MARIYDLNQIEKNIEKALKEEDFCEAMDNLGFVLVGYDEAYPDEYYYFMKRDNSLIIFYSAIDGRFITYPMANKRKISR